MQAGTHERPGGCKHFGFWFFFWFCFDLVKNLNFEKKVLNPIEKFKPDIILISAGFDAHKKDPLANINLESVDFFTITKKIIEIAEVYVYPRVTNHKIPDDILSNSNIRLVDAPKIKISSSHIRELLRTNKKIDGLVPKEVLGFIKSLS